MASGQYADTSSDEESDDEDEQKEETETEWKARALAGESAKLFPDLVLKELGF
jgi:Ran GTPase-activating protein (RanGAP) involved in mRNA processing and transport